MIEVREYRYNNLSEEVRETIDYDEFINGTLRSTTGTYPYFTVSGYVYWTDDNNATHPARHIKVEIIKKNIWGAETVLETEYTNGIGYYQVTLNGRTDCIHRLVGL
jgi:hypothetical protein